MPPFYIATYKEALHYERIMAKGSESSDIEVTNTYQRKRKLSKKLKENIAISPPPILTEGKGKLCLANFQLPTMTFSFQLVLQAQSARQTQYQKMSLQYTLSLLVL